MIETRDIEIVDGDILMDFYAFLSFSCFHTLEFLFSNPDKFIIDYLVDYIYRLKKISRFSP